MSKFKVKVWAGANMQGADWHEIVDLVDDYNISEERAADYIESLQDGVKSHMNHEGIEDDLREAALQMSGFEWGVSALEKTDV